ncbi:hydrogenase iron-sulfur subunit [uncultured Desulfobacter sp.]|uniref:hydrogenase iron-sulfur subunit n=1 Tax=uncultured Desulfobacter sp. TaxID=240139 RepID=UPI002AA8554B|nr:hydrogenase iron-sulfur subunit [uncultured Desulfobacter sp.]
MSNFEPEIVAFCCHYCGYTAADMAGTRRISYPSNVKIIRVPCTGKVDAIHLMKALEKGADGVYVGGCLEGDCHFKEGNLRADAHVEKVKKTLEDLGWEPERVAMMHFSAGMGENFAKAATEFTEKIKALGPSPASQATSKAV